MTSFSYKVQENGLRLDNLVKIIQAGYCPSGRFGIASAWVVQTAFFV